ncbi:MAG: glycosyltransferase family 39 protein [Acidobacteriia bacterium]|nr:glycosyltransferase family 39 protein [Terriglobia bacterium]
MPLILVVLYVCLFSGLGALGLVGPDEPRYAAIARAMAETGDWITPRLWGTPWFEKPVLYYWAAGICMRLFGVSEFAARLPSALAALLAVVAVAWTALRSFGVRAAWFSLLMLPTSVAMIGFSRAASPDMLFAGLLTASMAIALEILQKPRPGPGLRIAFGFFLGGAVLAKGPAAIVLAGGATLVWAALSRQWLAPFRFLHPLIIAVFCATALPWYVLCALRNPDFLRVFIWQHNFERYLTPVFEHRQPFWYYGPILLLAAVPWILFLIGAFPDAIRKWKDPGYRDSPGLLFTCWTVFPLVFFSLSQSKLPGYILPAVPPLFLLMGNWISYSLLDREKTVLRLVGWTGAFFLLFGAPSLVGIGASTGQMDWPEAVLIGGVTFTIGVIVIILAFKKQPMAALIAMACLVASVVLAANVVLLPEMDSRISARSLAQKLESGDPTLSHVAIYRLSRNWEFGLDFYSNRQLPEWTEGSGEPEWILSGTLPDQQFLDRYKMHMEDAIPGNRDLVFVFHRY